MSPDLDSKVNLADLFRPLAWVNRPVILRSRLRSLLWPVIVTALLFSLTILLGTLAGTFHSELGVEDSDEPAHYVTGLLIRDYIANRFPESPFSFAVRYYLHYPKVALGVWPPFFHFVEALWMLLFSPSHLSVFLMSAAITMLSVITFFKFVPGESWRGFVVLAGALYILLPDVQTSSASIMIDGLVAALELIAVLQLARYMETQRPGYAYAFGCVAALGALSKVNALAVLIVPFMAIGLTRKWHLLRRPEIWLSLLIVCVTAAPWNYFLLRMASNSAQSIRIDPLWALQRAGMSLQLLFSAAGVLLPFAAIGIWQHIVRPFRFSLVRPVHASALALIVGVHLFHAAVPATDFPRRYLLPCLAPLLIFVVPGFEWAASKLPFDRWSLQRRRLAVAVTALIVFFAFQFSLVRRTRAGFAPAAALLAQQAQPRVVLVASDAPREGMAVAEIALRDRRPRHYVVRGSKVLAHSDWFGGGYRPLFITSQEIFSYLDSVPVDYVLVDNRPARLPPHVDLLAQTLHAGSQTWRRAPVSAGPLTLWERIHPIAHGEPAIRVDMNNTLRGTLSVGPRTSGR